MLRDLIARASTAFGKIGSRSARIAIGLAVLGLAGTIIDHRAQPSDDHAPWAIGFADPSSRYLAATGPAPEEATARQTWLIVNVSGEVWTRDTEAGERTPLKEGATLAEGSWIETGENGFALMVFGKSRASVQANSLMQVVALSDGGHSTFLRQTRGVVEFDVEKRRSEHFMVETPYLIAGVKGTRFSVSVSGKAATVSVSSGVVSVASPAGGAAASVSAGQSATSGNASAASVSVSAAATGDGTGNGNGNAGNGNGNGDGNGNGNAGNGNGNGNGNAGNGNGNGNGSGNAGNGNGNAGGNGNGNAGGNGNGNGGNGGGSNNGNNGNAGNNGIGGGAGGGGGH